VPDYRDRPVGERVEAREFDDPKVRAYLDTLDEAAVRWRLGEPRIVTIYAEGQGHWHPGDGRPMLADEDPAVMQAIGRCAMARVRSSVPSALVSDAIHPAACGWCEYPQELLLGALDWAVWHSRYIVTELLVWARSAEERWTTYERCGRSSEYENPVWRDFFDLARVDRIRRVDRAMALEPAA
jgi:hypothetical protein